MSIRGIATVLAAAAGLVLALVLGGRFRELAALGYVLLVAAVVLVVLARRLRETLPPAPSFGRLVAAPPRRQEPAGQLEEIRGKLMAATWSQADLAHRLAPLVREIAAARLSRRHGIDLDRQPEQARALIGEGRLWQLAGPEPGPPGGRDGGGWSRQELAQLLDELEAI